MEYLSIGEKKFAPWPSDGTETDQNRIGRTCWLEAKDDLYRKGYIKLLTRASFIMTEKGEDLGRRLYWDANASGWAIAE